MRTRYELDRISEQIDLTFSASNALSALCDVKENRATQDTLAGFNNISHLIDEVTCSEPQPFSDRGEVRDIMVDAVSRVWDQRTEISLSHSKKPVEFLFECGEKFKEILSTDKPAEDKIRKLGGFLNGDIERIRLLQYFFVALGEMSLGVEQEMLEGSFFFDSEDDNEVLGGQF